jgi:flagella basal body P-ring formation protein FlgA
MIRTLAFTFLFAFTASSALAAGVPTLRAEVTVPGDIVHLSDLIDGLPAGVDAAVFRAPDLGTTGTVQAARILEAAVANGVETIATEGLTEVAVTRASRPIDLDAMQSAVSLAIEQQNALGDDGALDFTFDATVRPFHVEPAAMAPLQVSRIAWNPVNGRFDAMLTIPGATATAPVRVTGTAVESVPVFVFSRNLSRGDVVRQADIVIERKPRSQAQREAIDDAAAAIGQAVRRPVRAGQTVLQADLVKPDIVLRNDTVTLVYESPNMILTVRATAIESGAEGDTVSVLNPQSKRVVQALVTGPGRVTVLTRSTVAMN